MDATEFLRNAVVGSDEDVRAVGHFVIVDAPKVEGGGLVSAGLGELRDVQRLEVRWHRNELPDSLAKGDSLFSGNPHRVLTTASLVQLLRFYVDALDYREPIVPGRPLTVGGL